MLFGSYPRLLALALSMPELAQALGLGDIRVDSRLNEPLSAQIEIIGATPEELKNLRASVANPEIFERYRAERPAFLASAAIMVGLDAQGRPVLNIQSTEAFTEPLVNFLVDLRWGQEELVRDYSLLLDPLQLTPARPAAVYALAGDGAAPLVQLPVADLPSIVLATAAVDPATPPRLVPGTNPGASTAIAQHRVVAHDTLRAIARRAGARSAADQQRTMMAIFQANREAFAGNINRLHRGALLVIPSAEEIQAINGADAEREIRAQMAAWRPVGRPTAGRRATSIAVAPSASGAAPATGPKDPEWSAMLSAMNRLDGRVQFLQQALSDMTRQLASANARIGNVEHRAGSEAAIPVMPLAAQARPVTRKASLSTMAWALALLVGGLTYAGTRWLGVWTKPWHRRGAAPSGVKVRAADSGAPSAASPTVAEIGVMSAAQPTAQMASADPDLPADFDDLECSATIEITQPVTINVDTVEQYGPQARDEPDTVLMESLHPTETDGTTTALDYNLADLDGRAQHVEMPGSLHENVVVVERRKNFVDTLLAAIHRDPTRSDLRMKLLETLYTAAASNLRVFKQVARDLARNPERLSADEWQQVMMMGREIAAADALFADHSEDDVAACA